MLIFAKTENNFGTVLVTYVTGTKVKTVIYTHMQIIVQLEKFKSPYFATTVKRTVIKERKFITEY
jgi:hypothetical protein